MAKADKRERQRQNREAARIERERLIKRDRRMRALRGLLIVLVPVVILVIVFSLISGGDDDSSDESSGSSRPKMVIDEGKTYTATIETSKGTIEANLDAQAAPIATNNFVTLARKGFYDNLCIDRAAKDFVVQGGSPKCDQQGGPGYTVQGELPKDNYPEGSLAAAKGGQEAPGTMGSQFFIVTGPNGATLPNEYARFGKVTSGLDVAQSIEALAPASGDGKPTEKVTIKKITITES